MLEITSVAPQIKCPLSGSSPWLPREEELRFCPGRMFVDGVMTLTKTGHPGCVFPIGACGPSALLLEPIGSSPMGLIGLHPLTGLHPCPCRWGEGVSAQTTWAWTPAWPLPCYVTLSKSLSLWALGPRSANWR